MPHAQTKPEPKTLRPSNARAAKAGRLQLDVVDLTSDGELPTETEQSAPTKSTSRKRKADKQSKAGKTKKPRQTQGGGEGTQRTGETALPPADERASVELGQPLRAPSVFQGAAEHPNAPEHQQHPRREGARDINDHYVEASVQHLLAEHSYFSRRLHERLSSIPTAVHPSSTMPSQAAAPSALDKISAELGQLRGRMTKTDAQISADSAWVKATGLLLLEAYDSVVQRVDELVGQLRAESEQDRREDRQALEARLRSLEGGVPRG